jgi:hypothetical protein
MYKPTSQEAALLLRYAFKERGDRRRKEVTRVRLSRFTLKRLWNREQITDPWLTEVNEWLLSAGWTLVYAGTTFGAVKTSVVENWPRVASEHLKSVIDEMKGGTYDFSQLEQLLESENAVSVVEKASDSEQDKRPRVKRKRQTRKKGTGR